MMVKGSCIISEVLPGLGSVVLLMEKIICFRRRAIKNFSNILNNGKRIVATGCCFFSKVKSPVASAVCVPLGLLLTWERGQSYV